MTRAAIYARISKREDQTNENQVLKLQQYAARAGYDVVQVYQDEISGARDNRPGLEQLGRDAKAHRFQVVLCTKVDRMARSLLHLLRVCKLLDECHVRLTFVDQQIDASTSAGKMFLHFLGAVAEFEREIISERTKDGLARARAQGKRLGRPPKKRGPPDIYKLVKNGPVAQKTVVFEEREV